MLKAPALDSKNIKNIALLMVFACLLLLSGYLTEKQGFWFNIDRAVFYFFNDLMAENSSFLTFVAIINNRLFDVVSFITMGLVYFAYFYPQSPENKRRMIGIGITMLLTAVVMKQLGRVLPIDHPSPTRYFSDAFLASEHVSFSTKDNSSDSFPSDHGMFLMVFAAYMLRYFGRSTLKFTLPIVILFSLPRIMIGAHWLTDIYVGSLFMVCFVLSIFLMTRLSDICVDKITSWLPKTLSSKS